YQQGVVGALALRHRRGAGPRCYNGVPPRTDDRRSRMGAVLKDIYAAGRLAVSFELFPPKSDAGVDALFTHLDVLMKFQPDYVTCTYGAGGSTRERTLEVLRKVVAQYPGVPVASHLTCVGS